MRAIVMLCLVWCVAVCATPSVADRFLSTPHSPVQHDTGDELADGRGAIGGPAADVRVSCLRGDALTPLRYDRGASPDARKIDASFTVAQASVANVGANCR